MALLFADGCDHQTRTQTTLTYASKWNGGATGNPFYDAVGRFGGGGISLFSNNNALKTLAAGKGTLAVCFSLKQPASGGELLLSFRDAGTDQCTVLFKTTGNIEVRNGSFSGTLLATAAAAFSPGTYCWVGVKVVLGNAGTYTVQVNGATVTTGTGDLTATGNNTANQVLFNSSSTSAPAPALDDVLIMDATADGSGLSDLLPDCTIDTLYPTSDSAVAWTKSTGASNFACVDDAQYAGDTDYVSAATNGLEDLYGMGDLSVIPNTVYAVQVTVVARNEAAGTQNVKLHCKGGSTDAASAAVALSSTTYTLLSAPFLTDPATGAAWAAGGVNAALCGMETAA